MAATIEAAMFIGCASSAFMSAWYYDWLSPYRAISSASTIISPLRYYHYFDYASNITAYVILLLIIYNYDKISLLLQIARVWAQSQSLLLLRLHYALLCRLLLPPAIFLRAFSMLRFTDATPLLLSAADAAVDAASPLRFFMIIIITHLLIVVIFLRRPCFHIDWCRRMPPCHYIFAFSVLRHAAAFHWCRRHAATLLLFSDCHVFITKKTLIIIFSWVTPDAALLSFDATLLLHAISLSIYIRRQHPSVSPLAADAADFHAAADDYDSFIRFSALLPFADTTITFHASWAWESFRRVAVSILSPFTPFRFMPLISHYVMSLLLRQRYAIIFSCHHYFFATFSYATAEVSTLRFLYLRRFISRFLPRLPPEYGDTPPDYCHMFALLRLLHTNTWHTIYGLYLLSHYVSCHIIGSLHN